MNEGQEQTPTPSTPARELRLTIRINEEEHERITALANYAARKDVAVIQDNLKGNLTGWVNFCLQLGEQYLKQHALQRRGK